MPLDQLNSAQFHSATIAGCQRLIQHRHFINQINVFPIADGDTGDNLSSTCQAIIDLSSEKNSLADTLMSIADASIIGARGNSGIIFSQFFNLLHLHINKVENLEFNVFSQALGRISKEIPAVLSKAIDGTIITIIQKLAIYTEEKKDKYTFSQAMLEIVPLLFGEVEKTKDTLTILQETKVVDAGALGFYYFIEGFTYFLQSIPAIEQEKFEAKILVVDNSHLLNHPPEFRYCTELILKGGLQNKQNLLGFLKDQGDCASIAGNNRVNRIHVHTNSPRKIFTKLHKEYTIQYPKVDDMLRQYQLQFDRKYDIALVTDSSADLPQDLADKYQIYQICLNINMGDHQLLDKYSFEPDFFYKQLDQFKTYPKTSCLNTKTIEEMLEKISNQYDKVIVLSISSKMSGMYDAFIKSSNKFKNIHVLDTKTNSAAHGLLLHYAGQLIEAKVNFCKIIQLLKNAIRNTFIFVMVSQFDSMIRSGRVSKLSGKFADLVNIKPIVSVDREGNGIVVTKCFSSVSAQDKLINFVNQQLGDSRYFLEDYCIVHAGASDHAIRLSKRAKEVFGKNPLFIEAVSLSIGLHAGKGCIAIAARISENKR